MAIWDNGYFYALAASILFGAGAPVSKRLMGAVDPWMMAGGLYLSAGLGLSVVALVRSVFFGARAAMPWSRGSDRLYLLGATVTGGICAPLLLMLGLSRIEASQASLFFNVETVFTSLFAWFLFKERASRSAVSGMLAIFAGSVVLSWKGTLAGAEPTGALLVVLACLSWGLDNNFTRRISNHDPVRVSMIKSLVAGGTNVFLARLAGERFPGGADLWAVAGVGFASYGLSLVCFVMSLRHLGASRTSALFSTGPFVGAALAVVWLKEPVTLRLMAAASLMALGVWFYVNEGAKKPKR